VQATARTVAALLVLLGLTGCADQSPAAAPAPAPATATAQPGPTAAPPTVAPSRTVQPAAEPSAPGPSAVEPSTPAEQRCDHPTQGYSAYLPADWHVATGDGIEPCTFFHPEPLVLEPGSEATGVAVRAEVRDVPFEQARQDVLDEGGTLLEEGTVADRASARVQGVLAEEGLLPAGTRFTTWLVELDAGTLLLTTDDAGEDDYDTAVAVLDRMAATLEVP
jgi:hypothetical protein